MLSDLSNGNVRMAGETLRGTAYILTWMRAAYIGYTIYKLSRWI